MSKITNNPAIRAKLANPVAFRAGLTIEADRGERMLAECIEPWQAADFAALDNGWRRVVGQKPEGGCQRGYLERPRGHSKTADLAIMATWALFASPHKLAGVAAAADRDQARLLRDAIERLVRHNAWLQKFVTVQQSRVINPHTGSTLDMLSSDAPSSYGLTPHFIVIDELTHWQSRDLWDSLISAAAKRSQCLVVIISNAGFGASWQWQLREAIRSDPSWHFSRLSGPVASWLTAERLAEQRRLLPDIAYRRLWLNEWTAGSGDALREDDILASIRLAGPVTTPEPGWLYVAGLDLGLTRDASALVVVGKHIGHAEAVPPPPARRLPGHLAAMDELELLETVDETALWTDDTQYEYHTGSGKLKLAHVHVINPKETHEKVSIQAIESEIVELNRRLGLATVAVDPYQAAYLVERLRKQNIATEEVNFTGPNLRAMCSATLETFIERNIDLWPHERLLADLRSLRAEERHYGVRLTSPRGPNGHGDAATALSIALAASRRFTSGGTRIDGPLLAWP